MTDFDTVIADADALLAECEGGAEMRAALRPFRDWLKRQPRKTAEDDARLSESLAYAFELCCDDLEGADIEGRLRDFVSDEIRTVEKTRERIAEGEAEEEYKRRRVA